MKNNTDLLWVNTDYCIFTSEDFFLVISHLIFSRSTLFISFENAAVDLQNFIVNVIIHQLMLEPELLLV